MKKIELPELEVWYKTDFLSLEEAEYFFKLFETTVPWRQDPIVIFGKQIMQPRLTAFYSENDLSYGYSSIRMQPHAFTTELKNLKYKVEKCTQMTFNCCLLNFYRDGNDSNGWHSDDEKELGKNPEIASISLGGDRFFHLKHKKNKELKSKILLQNGSLLCMGGQTQHRYKHQIPKSKTYNSPRINLTFRRIFDVL